MLVAALIAVDILVIVVMEKLDNVERLIAVFNCRCEAVAFECGHGAVAMDCRIRPACNKWEERWIEDARMYVCGGTSIVCRDENYVNFLIPQGGGKERTHELCGLSRRRDTTCMYVWQRGLGECVPFADLYARKIRFHCLSILSFFVLLVS